LKKKVHKNKSSGRTPIEQWAIWNAGHINCMRRLIVMSVKIPAASVSPLFLFHTGPLLDAGIETLSALSVSWTSCTTGPPLSIAWHWLTARRLEIPHFPYAGSFRCTWGAGTPSRLVGDGDEKKCESRACDFAGSHQDFSGRRQTNFNSLWWHVKQPHWGSDFSIERIHWLSRKFNVMGKPHQQLLSLIPICLRCLRHGIRQWDFLDVVPTL
jgi:hypothetical protein